MSEIFISYRSERRKAAAHLAAVLSHHGYSAWLDYHEVEGADFGPQIDRRIREANALVVLWCSLSAGSRRVNEEARLAYELGILVPVMIEPCEPPAGFRRVDLVDLTPWDGAPRSDQLDPLMDALEHRIGRSAYLDLKGVRAYETAWRLSGARPLKAFALGAPVAGDKGGRSMPQAAGTSGPVTAPRPAPSLIDLRNEAQAFGAEGPVAVPAGDCHHSETRWFKPGGGEPFRDVDGGPEMVVVPAGTFMMGSPDDERERSAIEGPRHGVTFACPFAASRHAVTRGQFAAFVKATGQKTSDRWRKPGFMQDDSHPAVFVTWDAAGAFAAWMAEVTGWPYRLLTEAEWEYAARAGTATPYWWGASITPAQANYDGRYGTVPVGSFDPNPWGLYNMHGNVWEWCEDTWHGSYEGAPADGSAWIAEATETGRVVRGGSWNSNPGQLRAASRYRYSSEYIRVGFRVARMLTS
jgi:formylglycine-generating enzyme required for sulfatase activity